MHIIIKTETHNQNIKSETFSDATCSFNTDGLPMWEEKEVPLDKSSSLTPPLELGELGSLHFEAEQ